MFDSNVFFCICCCYQNEPEHFRYDHVSLANLNSSVTSVSKEESLFSNFTAKKPEPKFSKNGLESVPPSRKESQSK